MAFKLFKKSIFLPMTGLATGFVFFIVKLNVSDPPRGKPPLQQIDIVQSLQNDQSYKTLEKTYKGLTYSQMIPNLLRGNNICEDILFDRDRMGNNSMFFKDTKKSSLTAYYYLNYKTKKTVDNGVLALLFDECLCYCGFSSLPNGKGFTARLDITFERNVPLNTLVVLKAQVLEVKGHKCVINGTLESVPSSDDNSNAPPVLYAHARCLLVEPKWFKYLPKLST